MTIELWKPIYLLPTMEDVNPAYLISNRGNIKGLRGNLLKTSSNSKGYLSITLTLKDGRRFIAY